MIHYITGGERSGKSRLAQTLAEQISQRPYYLATARVLDDDFAERVERHISDRTDRDDSLIHWTTIEADIQLSDALEASCQDIEQPTIVIDCVTLWLVNFVMDHDYDIDKCLNLAKQEIEQLVSYAKTTNATIFIVSNEIGMSIHASTKEGRQFVALQGWVNQYLAQIADRATLVVSGLPVVLK